MSNQKILEDNTKFLSQILREALSDEKIQELKQLANIAKRTKALPQIKVKHHNPQFNNDLHN